MFSAFSSAKFYFPPPPMRKIVNGEDLPVDAMKA